MPTQISSRFRDAVVARQWSEAQALLDQLSGEAQAVWESAVTDDMRKNLAREIEETLDWAQRVVLAARAQDEHKRIHLVRRSGYYPEINITNHVTLEV